jgi:hypothetical protein
MPAPADEVVPLLEVLFRDAIVRFGTLVRDPHRRPPVFLAAGSTDPRHFVDPPFQVFERLADLNLNLLPASSAELDTTCHMWRDPTTGMYGDVITARIIRWLSPTEAQVRCGRYTSPLGAKGYGTQTARKGASGWQLPSRINCWVS